VIARIILMSGAMLVISACGKSDAPTGGSEPAVEAVAAVALSGEAVFQKCAACHSVEKGGKNGIGPNLYNIVGRQVGSDPTFTYSNAMKTKGGNWDAASLDAYIAGPAKYMPGTRMSFAGLQNPNERNAVVEYMATLK
jgi:cytochrome c